MRAFLSILVWAYWTICFHLCLLVVAILFVITYPFDQYRQIPNKTLKSLAWMILKPVPTWYFEIRGASKGKIQKPTLVVANHQSFLDIPLLYLLPWSMKWVTKKGLLRIPVLGWLTAMSGHIPIDRKSLRSFSKMNALVEPIQNGIPGLIFPEGTRSATGDLKSFKNGAFSIAQKYNFQVLPVVLEGGHRAMPRGSWKFWFNNKFIVSVLDPVDPANFDDPNALNEAVFHQIEQELSAIRSPNC